MFGIDRINSMQHSILVAVPAKAFLDGTSASFFGFEVDVINVHVFPCSRFASDKLFLFYPCTSVSFCRQRLKLAVKAAPLNDPEDTRSVSVFFSASVYAA
jgi:hypothetical protein